jgi:hypothetical protein
MVAEPLFSLCLAVALVSSRRSPQVDRLDDERKRNHQHADHGDHPELIDIEASKSICVCSVPPTQGNRLRRRVRGVRTLRLEVAHHRVDGLLIADIGGCGMLDQVALMELLALRQNSLRQ